MMTHVLLNWQIRLVHVLRLKRQELVMGKPSKGTPRDKRLKENKRSTKKVKR
jgi:hypothetical protein